MKRTLCVMLVPVLLVLFLTPASLAVAAGPSKGPLATAVAFQCSIALDHFPQPVKTTNSANCDGLTGGVIAGLQSNEPGGGVVAPATASPISMTYQYTEPCVEGAFGFANGVIKISGLNVVDVTKGAAIGVRTGTYSVPYGWTRIGAIVIIFLGKINPLVDAKTGWQASLTWPGGAAYDTLGEVGLALIAPAAIPDYLINDVCPGEPRVFELIGAIAGV